MGSPSPYSGPTPHRGWQPPSEGKAAEQPGLSAPQRVKTPSGHHWFQAGGPQSLAGVGDRHARVVQGTPLTSLHAQTKPAAGPRTGRQQHPLSTCM